MENDMNSVKGLNVLVTAGASGIGRTIAETFENAGANIHICDTDLGNFNTLDKFGKVLTSQDKLYHLITDTGFFYVNGIKVRDYNSAIENILDVRDKLYALS